MQKILVSAASFYRGESVGFLVNSILVRPVTILFKHFS